ncbi:hypothetical protein Hypma_001568 [Hypsizygus marmoreus]|uniref:Uncharacterized protein n=1 Tax=Hypsizygus marmoreus TaxID=39966 RepID=A0A369K5L5_HYPMA|nr:hypothetical protein Hypma_001568 [Hypsizygus marmoreus]
MPDGEATIEHDAMQAQTQFYTCCEGNCLVPKTLKLLLQLSDLKKESLVHLLIIFWMLVGSQSMTLLETGDSLGYHTLELYVQSGLAACSDPPEAEVQRFLIMLHQSLKEFNTLHCNMGS